MQILDLRQIPSRKLEPLFQEETRHWRDELHWDYGPSVDLIRKFVDSHSLGGYVAMHPSFVVVCAYVTCMWEVLFIFLVWKPMTRRVVLSLGILFHVMTCLTLGLFIFPMICLSAYPLFATDCEIESLRRSSTNAWNWLVAATKLWS